MPWPALCGYFRGQIPMRTRARICELSMAGWRPFEIVRELGLKKGTVESVLNAMRRELAQVEG
ncbi:MAG: hypothetical protein WD316_08985 [Phycisphaeraceae bacterium]